MSNSNKLAKREPLTRERIFKKALELADKGGIESVSMRQIAQGLNVEAMSLYKHIANKEDIMDGFVELLFEQMTLPPAESKWQEALRERAYSLRKVLNKYPWASSLIETRSFLGPARLRHHDNMIGILRNGGFSIEAAYNILIAITSYTYGFAIMEQAWFSPAVEPEKKLSKAHAPPPISSTDYPHLLEMLNFVSGKGDGQARPQPGLASEFEFGLNNLLQGFEKSLVKK